MVLNSADLEGRTAQGFGDAAQIGMQLRALRFVAQKRATFFGGEDQMQVNNR